jgi:hypothetical protein
VYLCSAGIKFTVFVGPSNFNTTEAKYKKISGSTNYNLQTKSLYPKPAHLTMERMKRLMTFGYPMKDLPLYMQTVIKTLGQMALEKNVASILSDDEFRKRTFDEKFTVHQS